MINYNDTQIIQQEIHNMQKSFDVLANTTIAHQNLLTQPE